MRRSDEYCDVSALKGYTRNPSQMVEVIADNGLEGDDHPQFVELLGEEEGIRVLTVRSEHLRSDRNDFSDHLFSLAPRKSSREELSGRNDRASGDVPCEVVHAAVGGEDD